jgi:hypothetical protein
LPSFAGQSSCTTLRNSAARRGQQAELLSDASQERAGDVDAARFVEAELVEPRQLSTGDAGLFQSAEPSGHDLAWSPQAPLGSPPGRGARRFGLSRVVPPVQVLYDLLARQGQQHPDHDCADRLGELAPAVPRLRLVDFRRAAPERTNLDGA